MWRLAALRPGANVRLRCSLPATVQSGCSSRWRRALPCSPRAARWPGWDLRRRPASSAACWQQRGNSHPQRRVQSGAATEQSHCGRLVGGPIATRLTSDSCTGVRCAHACRPAMVLTLLGGYGIGVMAMMFAILLAERARQTPQYRLSAIALVLLGLTTII